MSTIPFRWVDPFDRMTGLDGRNRGPYAGFVYARAQAAREEYDRALGRDPRPSPALRALAKKYGGKP